MLTMPAHAKVITLKDGSTVKGEIVNIENGAYKIHTETLGDVSIPDTNIVSITTEQPSVQPAQTTQKDVQNGITATPEFKTIQGKVMGDPQMLGEIQQLMQDPEVMAILADPSFLATVQSGNIAALQSDPRLKSLSENPKIQALIQKIQPGQ